MKKTLQKILVFLLNFFFLSKKKELYKKSKQTIFKQHTFDDVFLLSKKSIKEGKIFRSYSKDCPSPHYSALLNHYSSMHDEKSKYPGDTLVQFLPALKKIFRSHDTKTVLDFGSGKGVWYKEHEPLEVNGEMIEDVKTYWGVEKITPFDPAVRSLDQQSFEKYDAVISTDVLEHCYVADIPWIVDGLFKNANKIVFVSVSCRYANAVLPTGEQAHSTIQSPWWWQGIFDSISNNYGKVDYYLCCDSPDDKGNRKKYWFSRKFHNVKVVEGTIFGRNEDF